MKQKRILAFLLSLAMILSLMPTNIIFAAENTTESIFAGGSGTEDDPYKIATLEQLKAFCDNINYKKNTYEGKFIKLTASIDLSGNGNWDPIATDDNYRFEGTFDGKNHKITGLKTSKTRSEVGLFCYIGENGKVKNLCVDGTVNGGSDVGSLAAYNYGTIENCYSKGKVTSSYQYVGGLVSKNCGTIKNCYNTADVTGGYSDVGGLVGNNSGKIENCYNTGSVNGNGENVGGLVGFNYINSTIKNCYNTGNVIGKKDCVGGVVGYNLNKIENCYNIGIINGSNSYIGGINGFGSYPKNSYYLDTCAAEGTTFDVATGTALTAEQMKDSSNFNEWDFENVWNTDSSSNRPFLRDNNEFLPPPEPEIPPLNLTMDKYDLDGDGIKDSVYEISNADAFMEFGSMVNNYNKNLKAVLTKDIDLSGYTWSPIGINYSDFEGIFDGQGHTISNMKFKTAQNGYGGDDNLTYDYQGLFGVIRNNAIVRNFTITGEITLAADGQRYIGGAVGLAYENALVSNITSYVNIKDGGTAYKNIESIGGVVGRIGNNHLKNTAAYVDNCKYYGTIHVDTASKVGGVVGNAIRVETEKDENGQDVVKTRSSVTNCVNYGTVGWNYIGHIGGVVGSTENAVLVKNCANYGNVSACRNDCIGGVVGYIQDGKIENCLNAGKVTGKKSGLANEPDVYLGGILGYQNNKDFEGVTNCFNYGKITDLDNKYTYTGAIVGYSRDATGGAKIKDNYYINSSLAGSTQKASGSGTIGTNTSVTPIRAASGEIAYKMQAYITDGEQVWGQKLSGENYEAYPTVGGEKVYYGTNCNGTVTYANEEIKSEHNYSNGVCQNCGASQTINKNNDGYYEIGSKAEYICFTNLVNSNGGKDVLNAVLTADIDLSGYNYIPIGKDGNEFIGTFDGGGHKIENLSITANNSYMGMFGRTKGATVKNFTVSGDIYAVCNTLERIGGVIGQADNTAVSNVISKVNFKDNGKIEHIFRAGGIMAVATNGTTITNCEYSGDVKLHFGSTMGGMVGDVYDATKENPIVIKNCVNKANMTFDISRRVAGIVGWSDTYTSISQCENYGNITIIQSDGTNQAAGILGATIHAVTVEDCANYGNITDGKFNSSVGGIVGYIEVKESARADFGGVKNCFNYGKITNTNEKGSTYWGSVIGFMHKNNDAIKDKITNNYYLKDTAPTISGTEGIALTATEVSAETVSSGELAYSLQGTRDKKVWGQTLTGENKTLYPIIGGDRVHKVTFMVSGKIYATKYANETGIGTLPENPGEEFAKWLCGQTADSAEFTAQTPISDDITVYAFGSEKPADNTEKSDVVTAYPGETITVILSDYIKTASGTTNGFSFALKEGSTLPQGLVLLNGTVSGVPQQLGETEVTFTVTNDGEISLMSLNEEKTELTLKFNVKFKGEGTEQAPYEINSLVALEIFRDSVNGGNNYSGKFVKLTGDIDMSDKYGEDKASWSPIGNTEERVFGVKFNGDGHKITGMYINSSSNYQGLFGYTEYAAIENLNVSGSITVSGNYYVGGIVGYGENMSINNCSFEGSISGEGNNVGGIAGYLEGTIKNCVNRGDITAENYIGGIVGNGLNITIENCYNIGKITAANNTVGGIAGNAVNPIIKNCYNTGDITGNFVGIGGIIGYHRIDIHRGGTSVLDRAIENCYNSGKITSSGSMKGGIIGGNSGNYYDNYGTPIAYEIIINNCYYLDSSVSGGNYTAEKFGKTLTAEQMQHSENFANWDFETLWKEGAKRPMLRAIPEPVGTVNNPDLAISTVSEFKAFRDSVNNGNSYEGKYITLTADLDLEGSEENQWTAIGTSEKSFNGMFDGDGHKISGLYINNTLSYQGLFGYIDEKGVVKNLSIDGNVKGGMYVGGVVATNSGTVENCSFSGSVSGSNAVGGIVGMTGSESTVKNCYNTGSVSSTNIIAGGVVGKTTSKYAVENCYNTGNVSGSNRIGGVVGYNTGVTVKNCYNTGSVSGTSYVGGVVGRNTEEYAEVTNCYYLKDTTFITKEEESPGDFGFGNLFSTTDSGTSGEAETVGTELTAEQMKKSSSFEKWDFTNVWVMKSDRPILKNNPEQLFEIKSVGADGGKATATVLILKAGTYTVVFSDYENGVLKGVHTKEITVLSGNIGTQSVTSDIDLTLNTGDKVMLWDGIDTMTPMCGAYEVN